MLVYMLLNEMEERVYVGQTCLAMNDRLKAHAEAVREGSTAPVHAAMRRWPEEWACTYVILQACYSQSELDAAEEAWIAICSSAETGVGYNVHRSCHGGTSALQRREPMSEERRQFFRECGKKGAAHGKKGGRSRATMSEEELERYREWGRKGAAASKHQ